MLVIDRPAHPLRPAGNILDARQHTALPITPSAVPAAPAPAAPMSPLTATQSGPSQLPSS